MPDGKISGMYLSYGNYSHQPNEAEISFIITSKFNEGGQVYQQNHRWTIQGLLLGSSATDLDTKWAALRNAYDVQGKTISLYHDNGTLSVRQLRTQDCIGGTRVVQPPTSQFQPGTHTTFIPYQIVVEGDVPNPDVTLVSFKEILKKDGGGPLFLHLEPLYGPPVKQQIKTDTTYRVVQEGEAIGFYSYPVAPGPVLGAANLIKAPQIELGSPKRSGPVGSPFWTEYPIKWVYNFESASPLNAIPNRWI